jgi:uncharacterized protein (DUF2147 family)
MRRKVAMNRLLILFTGALIGLAGVASSAAAQSQRPPTKQAPAVSVPAPQLPEAGIWIDDTGQGAIEIMPCAERLCGRIVWLKDPFTKAGAPLTDGYNPEAKLRQRPICGLQVIGDLKLQPNGAWDQGWIYDPKEGKSYDVEIMLKGPDRLQVKGYLGVKFLSETFIWTRAPADIQRCAVVNG